jgi:uncharacterized repeat protein (TIGR03847 family)
MNQSFDFGEVEALLAVAIGEPGDRTFYFQVHGPKAAYNFKAEKVQVRGIAEYLEKLADASGVGGSAPLPKAAPIDTIEWTVGEVTVALEETAGRIHVVLSAISEFSEVEAEAEFLGLFDAEISEEGGPSDEDTEDDPDEEDDNAGVARLVLTPALARSFAVAAKELVAAGREICDLCGLPIDPGGHFCPRMN